MAYVVSASGTPMMGTVSAKPMPWSGKRPGKAVISPETYQEAIPGTISLKTEGTFTPDRDGIYRGNQTDLSALIAAMLSLTTLASCFGGIYCMPILALILGAIAYRNADIAIEGQRTKVLVHRRYGNWRPVCHDDCLFCHDVRRHDHFRRHRFFSDSTIAFQNRSMPTPKDMQSGRPHRPG